MCEDSRVCISSSPCRCDAVIPGALACVHVYIHMRVCVDVYAYICAGVHVCVYMHMRLRPCTRTCARICMHTYAQMEGPGDGALACLVVSWARVRTHVHVHACARTHVHVHACARVYTWTRMCTACSQCYIHFGTDVLGTSVWEGVHVTQVCFYTNIHICDTLTAGCAHVCVYGCVCLWMRVCVYDIA